MIVDVVLFNVVLKLVKKDVEPSNTVVVFVPLFVSNAVTILVDVSKAVVRETVVKALT